MFSSSIESVLVRAACAYVAFALLSLSADAQQRPAQPVQEKPGAEKAVEPESKQPEANKRVEMNLLGKTDAARADYEQARYIWENVLGPEHPAVAAAWNNLGTLQLEHESFAPWPGWAISLSIVANFLFTHTTIVGILAFCLTAHIVHFQRQNGQAIEEIARRFRVQFCLSEPSGVVLVETGKQPYVKLLNLGMALLIEGIDGMFALGNETLRGPWPAYTVFHMP